MPQKRRGRPRDTDLDEAILIAAHELLATEGLGGLSYAAVAKRAGTTRPAIYRRYATIEALAVAAIGRTARSITPDPTGDLHTDLVAELTSFRDGITSVDGLSLTAVTLDAATDESIKAAYRRTVVAPRRARLAAILAAAHTAGHITATPTDQAALVSMCTGSWYAYAIAGTSPPTDWPAQTASLIIRAAR